MVNREPSEVKFADPSLPAPFRKGLLQEIQIGLDKAWRRYIFLLSHFLLLLQVSNNFFGSLHASYSNGEGFANLYVPGILLH